MNVVPISATPSEIGADAMIVGVTSDRSTNRALDSLDRATNGKITRIIDSDEFKSDANEVVKIMLPEGISADCVLLVGLGSSKQLGPGVAFRAYASAAKSLSGIARKHVAVFAPDSFTAPMIEAAAAGILCGCHGSDLYRNERRQKPFAKTSVQTEHANAVTNGLIVGECINATRDLVNESPDRLYPLTFAERAHSACVQAGMEFELWDKSKLEKERCGALLAVAQGSERSPCLVIMRHQGAESPNAPWLALVGKGVTFDSGGLSLKTADSMVGMKADMAGAATVLGAMQAINALHLPVNVIGLAGLVENMPSATSFRPSDVLIARNGKSIEVINTDAEGRLVLADVLSVAIDCGADKIIDLATLTGACMVALGSDVAGIMSNDSPWCDAVKRAAEAAGEFAWELPMFEEYAEQLKSDFADIKNLGTRWGGAITAAKFLEAFVGSVPWVHIDIAGPAFLEKPKPWMDVGGTGTMVRTLVEVARTWH